MATTDPKSSNRLTATLIALAASMVVGAGLLNYVHDLTGFASASHTRLSSTQRPDPDWRAIRITAESHSNGPVPFHHFYIGLDGDEHDTLAWRQNLQDANASRSVHVLIANHPGVVGPTRKQWETLVARVRLLQARFAIPTLGIAIEPPASPTDADARTEHEQTVRMLQTAGLLG